jgi:hypothetical protein
MHSSQISLAILKTSRTHKAPGKQMRPCSPRRALAVAYLASAYGCGNLSKKKRRRGGACFFGSNFKIGQRQRAQPPPPPPGLHRPVRRPLMGAHLASLRMAGVRATASEKIKPSLTVAVEHKEGDKYAVAQLSPPRNKTVKAIAFFFFFLSNNPRKGVWLWCHGSKTPPCTLLQPHCQRQ